MKPISEQEILHRFGLENPWWDTGKIPDDWRSMSPRAYLPRFLELLKLQDPVRAIVLMGPRRVGKSILIHHAIQRLLEDGVPAEKLCYLSIDAPVYTGLGLEPLLRHYVKAKNTASLDGAFIFFDEVQYLPNWEQHLKKLVEDYPRTKFVASGSAAAALKLKSNESGAGRFTDFQLPPLTFHEFLVLSKRDGLIQKKESWPTYHCDDMGALNHEFLNYLNYGGYPEAIFSQAVRNNPDRFIKTDIIEKVLLKDLPILYGIAEIQELNRLFTMLAYNTAQEVSLDELSQSSGVAKNTIKRYLEYLQAAFLIREVHRVDFNFKFFKRANFFKVYLANPSMRSALFGPITETHESAGHLAETAVMSQLVHYERWTNIYYGRWPKGEVDFITHDGARPIGCAEIKWSNRAQQDPREIAQMISFMEKNDIAKGTVTTIDVVDKKMLSGREISFVPCAIFCYGIGVKAVQLRTHSDTSQRL